MKIYADTSVLIAWFHPADEFASAVTKWCQTHGQDFSWNIFLRAELRHNLRRLSTDYAAVAWQAYRAAESSGRLRLDSHKPNELIEWGDELSARHAKGIAVGTWDCVHVAAAQHAKAEIFITCDIAQAELASLAKLPKVHLF